MAGAPSLLEAVALAAGALLAFSSLLRLARVARWAKAPLEPAGSHRPRATVIVPARGEHVGFADNVRSLAAQEGLHELLYVVDGLDDPAAKALLGLQRDLPRLRIIRVDPAEASAGWATGKIAAQVTGTKVADPASEVLVFADADMRAPQGWLACMVAPLGDARVGAVTGFQAYWAAQRATVWTGLRDAMVSVALERQMGPRRFLWGGSMAVRRVDFDRSSVLQEWKRHIADDTGLTKAVSALGLRIAFAPGALTAAREDWSRAEVLAWFVKEYALVRSVTPGAYKVLALLPVAMLGPLLAGVAFLAAGPTALLRVAGALLVLPTLLGLARAGLRWRLVRRALPDAVAVSRRERALQTLGTFLLPWLMPWLLWRASRLPAIQWRGRAYAVDRDPPPE